MNSSTGIEKSARLLDLRGGILKIPPPLKHEVTVFGIPARELKKEPVLAFYEAAF